MTNLVDRAKEGLSEATFLLWDRRAALLAMWLYWAKGVVDLVRKLLGIVRDWIAMVWLKVHEQLVRLRKIGFLGTSQLRYKTAELLCLLSAAGVWQVCMKNGVPRATEILCAVMWSDPVVGLDGQLNDGVEIDGTKLETLRCLSSRRRKRVLPRRRRKLC